MIKIQLFNYFHEKYIRWISAKLDKNMCQKGDFWLFILGVNNSGTTILSKILEEHPEIQSLPLEGQLLTEALPRPDLLNIGRLWSSRMDIFRWEENHDPKPALKMKKDWEKFYSKGKGILLEKSPPNTVRSLWIQKNFIPSRFVTIIRNPYAVCEGIKRRKNYTIEQAALHWNTANTCLLNDLEQIKYNYFLKYEDLVDSPSRILEDIENFLELKVPFNIESCNNISAHSIEGATTGLRNLNDDSIERLSEIEIQTINTICGDLMYRLGYSSRDTKC